VIAAIALLIFLILLGLTSDFLVDWLWFSEIGYPGVFWTTIFAQAATFCAAFLATVLILWVNGALAHRLARLPWARLAHLRWERGGVVTPPDPLELIRHHLGWPFVIGCGASLIAILVGWGEVHNWSVFLRFFYQVPSGASDPIYDNDIGFYLFSLPAYIAIKNWMLLTLFLSALFAGAVYWVQGHIAYDAQRRAMSSTAIAHGSVLLALFFAVKAWSYGLDRYLLLYGRSGCRRELYRRPFNVAHPMGPRWVFNRRSRRDRGECAGAQLPASRGSGAACVRWLLCPVNNRASIISAFSRHPGRIAAREALYRAQHRVHSTSL
jgi:uncharacterized membrane protein (UPF0182 family)